MKKILFFAAVLALTACFPEDRSGEVPLAPTVQTVSAEVAGDSVVLTGEVLSSPNSSIKSAGFDYGNDSVEGSVTVDSLTTIFSAVADSLETGTYYAVAWAQNGIGTSYGDTIYFQIEE